MLKFRPAIGFWSVGLFGVPLSTPRALCAPVVADELKPQSRSSRGQELMAGTVFSLHKPRGVKGRPCPRPPRVYVGGGKVPRPGAGAGVGGAGAGATSPT